MESEDRLHKLWEMWCEQACWQANITREQLDKMLDEGTYKLSIHFVVDTRDMMREEEP